MPIVPVLGQYLQPVANSYKVPSLPVSKAADPPIQTDRFFRNGKMVDASAFNALNVQMNQAMAFRTKEVFSIMGDLGSAPGIQATSNAGTTDRWRFAFHTGPYTHCLLARAVLFPPSSNYGYDTYTKLKIFSDAIESTLVNTTEFHYGPGPSTSSVGGWQYHRVVDHYIEGLTADTDYYGLISDQDYGRIQSIAIADLQSLTENFNGYLPTNFTEHTPVNAKFRQNLVSAMPGIWKRNGAKVFGWTTNLQVSFPQQTTSATAINLFDTTSTTYGASVPGYTLDMTGKARLGQQSTGVPIVVKAFVSCSSAASGVVHLRDSSGTVLATLTNGYGAGSAGWLSATALLPATVGKYYLTFQTAAGTFSVYAVSAWEQE